MNINVKTLHPNARIPTYATDGSACFDLHSVSSVKIPPNTDCVIPTGLSFELEPGCAMFIKSRSGLAFKHGVTAFSGVCDADYTGEVRVLLRNDGNKPYEVHAGDRIAQAYVQKVERCEFWEVEELTHTERGAGGFGHSGR